METPRPVLPVIDYESVTSSLWPELLQMMGIIGIALGAVLSLNVVLSGSLDWSPPAFGLQSVALSLLLAAGSIGCLCLQPWGRVLLMIWACQAPVQCACQYFLREPWAGVTKQGPCLLLLLSSKFLYEWLSFCLFPLMIFLLLWPRQNWSKLTSGGQTSARAPLQRMIRAIGLFGIAIGLFTSICMLAALWYVRHQRVARPDLILPIALLLLATGPYIMLLTASVACWRLRPYGRWLFVAYAIMSVAFQCQFYLSATQHDRWSLNHVIQDLPFPLVIVLLMVRRQIRAAFGPQTKEP